MGTSHSLRVRVRIEFIGHDGLAMGGIADHWTAVWIVNAVAIYVDIRPIDFLIPAVERAGLGRCRW